MSDPTKPPEEPLDLETFARVAAELDAGRGSREEVLLRRGVPAALWERAQLYWSRRLADDAMEDGPLTDAYAAAIARAREELGPVPAMTPEEWAHLSLDVAERGADAALAARGLLPADYFRLAKHWAARLASDAAASARHAKALLASARERSQTPR